MKNITLVAIFSFVTLWVGAQNITNFLESSRTNSFFTDNGIKKQLPDSIIKMNVFGFSLSKSVFVYDKEGYVTSEEVYLGVGNNWSRQEKKIYEYDANKNIILEELYEAEDGEWIASSRQQCTFNENNDLTSQIKFVWQENRWQETDNKLVYTYDKDFNKLMEEVFIWNAETGNWINKEKNVFTYEDGFLSRSSRYTWTNEDWFEDRKSEFVKETADIVVEFQYAFINEEWIQRTKIERVYDERKNMLKEQASLRINESWIDSYREEFQYDENNNQIFYARAIYVSTGWNNQRKWEAEYDKFNNLLSKRSYGGMNDNWYENALDLYLFDADNRVSSIEHYIQEDSEVELSGYTIYYYPAEEVGLEYLAVPENNSYAYIYNQILYIHTPSIDETVNIYQLDGTLIYSGKIAPIPVSALPHGALLVYGDGWRNKVIIP